MMGRFLYSPRISPSVCASLFASIYIATDCVRISRPMDGGFWPSKFHSYIFGALRLAEKKRAGQALVSFPADYKERALPLLLLFYDVFNPVDFYGSSGVFSS